MRGKLRKNLIKHSKIPNWVGNLHTMGGEFGIKGRVYPYDEMQNILFD
jgi:hypothetical protein